MGPTALGVEKKSDRLPASPYCCTWNGGGGVFFSSVNSLEVDRGGEPLLLFISVAWTMDLLREQLVSPVLSGGNGIVCF